MAKENRDWGYDRIVGALANLGYGVCDQTVGNVLQRHGLVPAPERKRTTTWPAFIRTHWERVAAPSLPAAHPRSTVRSARGPRRHLRETASR